MIKRQQTLSSGTYEWVKISLSGVLALTAGIGGFFFAGYRHGVDLKDKEFLIQVVNAANNSPIPSSRVVLYTAKHKQSVATDIDGRAMFKIPADETGLTVTLHAEAEGFKAEDKALPLDKTLAVYLSPLEHTSPASELVPYTQVFRTGLRPSGSGSEYSAWYELVADPPKPGFVIDQQSSTFMLVGDRTCSTGWAECVRAQATEATLAWRFRMQGHNENPFNQGVAPSEGILKVVYVPQGR